ncbi:hypothetical protein pmac_cds_298 [Pandoravirus macleodensis]|uniref:Uncharacterized protein n=1 Tax=Pandoravirus macleodensis TaxID=2107707 RepID=A0A2U7UEW7_9VIRU|nr:hypothetical protein pmac_cds_298 [Pandoravirus macleodensis]AVK76986.1 hypothetical protein pmac_cds_298 [Pandoravirus macleodensis]UMO79643.1 hypothetical protein [Pandoravirus aubagnensis]
MNYQYDPRYGNVDVENDTFGGAALGMEPDALAAAYARALGVQPPVSRSSSSGGGFRGIAAPPRRRAAAKTNAPAFAAVPASAPRASRRSTSKRPDPSALRGVFAVMPILNEQPANAAS